MSRWAVAAAAIGLAIAAAVFLYAVPPEGASVYPRCGFYLLTGCYCPGCGAARCLHALTHGEIRQAAAYNVLVLIAVPFLLLWGVRAVCRFVLRLPVGNPRLSARVILLLFWVILAFWILRNLPFHPFLLLAPHQLGGD